VVEREKERVSERGRHPPTVHGRSLQAPGFEILPKLKYKRAYQTDNTLLRCRKTTQWWPKLLPLVNQ